MHVGLIVVGPAYLAVPGLLSYERPLEQHRRRSPGTVTGRVWPNDGALEIQVQGAP